MVIYFCIFKAIIHYFRFEAIDAVNYTVDYVMCLIFSSFNWLIDIPRLESRYSRTHPHVKIYAHLVDSADYVET